MNLLGGSYDSEDEEDNAEPDSEAAGPSPPSVPAGAASGPKRKKIDYSKLPMSRPLALDATGVLEEAPLKKVADRAKSSIGHSLLAALPPPKVTLGRSLGEGSGSRLDLSEVIRPAREKSTVPVEGLLRADTHRFADYDEVSEVPAKLVNHPMFSTDSAKPDGPSLEDLEALRKPRQFVEINADDMKDPDWYMKNQIKQPQAGETIKDEASMYDGKGWRSTTHANPNRVQKRKHQINWLATEAMEKEAEMIDRGQAKFLTKAQTSAKYGW